MRGLVLVGGLALLYVPLLAVVVLSVNASRLGVRWGGFTLSWYARAWGNEVVLHALWNTVVLACVSTAVATVLGTMLAMGMGRYPWPGWVKKGFSALVHLPVVTPDIIFAAALVVVFRLMRELTGWFELGLGTMIIGHVTFQIAFVALVVRARLATIEPDVEEAARDLGAGSWDVTRRVLLPLLMPGIVAGALLAFTLSLDDFVISFFTSGPESATLPIYIFSSLKRGISPEIHAISTVIFLVTAMLAVGMQVVMKEKKGTADER